MISTLIVIAKEPLPGRVKTRLTPPLTPHQAAQVAAAALRDTLTVTAEVAAQRHLLAFDGDPGRWAPPGWDVVAQVDGELDRRLAGAFAATTGGPAILVAMDTPQLRAAQLTAFDATRYDACLGMAADGGYWAIGFRDPGLATSALLGVPMSRLFTGAVQLRRMSALGMRVQLLDELVDVDEFDSARIVAALAPDSSFARTLATCARADLGPVA